ncbi:MAG: type III-B CRISPR-associated protein Cas10/Cmr2 [Thermodesulfobacteriota bacterium]|nr:type III-B CRISPR-associated protein Cas10/Cmr2 [Thermodesulfobacteriota bacterium]
MTFTPPDAAYWERKLIAYLHDPLDKILQIQGHESRSALFLEKYGLQAPNEKFWKKADGIAAGFERGQVPSYDNDKNKNGAVNFLQHPVITHPTSEKGRLDISLPDVKPELINDQLLEFIEREIGMKPGEGGYSDQFEGDEDRFAVARFFYTHLALRFKLSENDIGGLGALWHRLPADTRFPDHSIWQHNALCSALNSCMELASDSSEIGMMVFSLGPVQPFIAKARKLRDYWTGSVLLSWLAFEGIKWVMENLGPDHILYPSLIDQPLVNEYLEKNWKVGDVNFLNTRPDIASFPNKFLFLIPMDMAENISEKIKIHIRKSWKQLYENCSQYLTEVIGNLDDEATGHIEEMFQRQCANFWEFQWAAANLVSKGDQSEIQTLLPKNSHHSNFQILEQFKQIIADKPYYDNSGKGVLYAVSHSLVQSALAAAKNRKTIGRSPENGEKCHLCGEFEVLHADRYTGDIKAKEYKKNVKDFWHNLKVTWPHVYDFNESEKLCALCLTKRIAYMALRHQKDHILNSAFRSQESFPMTTEIALFDYYERNAISAPEERAEIANELHDSPEDRLTSKGPKPTDADKYYAILLMDGDKMGKLVNGETLASTWKTVLHPEMRKRLENPDFDKKYYENWKTIFDQYNRRLLTPAIHAAISESLCDFSIYGVAKIIKDHQGALIYAGGDDVCAVLPVSSALSAAQKIKDYYQSTYKLIQKENIADIETGGTWQPQAGKLSISLGTGPGLSISAGIRICHHKENLSQMITGTHYLLDGIAKKEGGRNACAVELRKRSGGSRYFIRKWDNAESWKSFTEIGIAIKDKNKVQISSSLVYRLEKFRDGIEAILEDENNYKTHLEKFFAKQLERSSINADKAGLANKMADITISKDREGNLQYKPEGLIVAAFMAQGGAYDELV